LGRQASRQQAEGLRNAVETVNFGVCSHVPKKGRGDGNKRIRKGGWHITKKDNRNGKRQET